MIRTSNRKMVFRLVAICFIVLMPEHSFSIGHSSLPEAQEDKGWMETIRTDHPRLFFNPSTFPQVQSIAFGSERKTFERMKLRIDSLLDKRIEFKDVQAKDGTLNRNHQYGFRAAESALLYRLLKEDKYLDYTKKVLSELTAYYHLRNNAKLNIHWYAYSRIAALCAYDWVCNDLPEEERMTIGKSLLSAVNGMMYNSKRKKFFRENVGGYKTGFYGPPVLPWYAGLVFYKAGIDDPLAEKFLLKGYNDHIKLLEYRKSISGDVGGASTATVEYSFRFYPWAEFNFFHTFQSATGTDIASEWSYLLGLLHYMDWNWLPKNRHFGYGDVEHVLNELPLKEMDIHLAQLIHFYGEGRPEFLARAREMQQKCERNAVETFPFIRFFLSSPQDGGKKINTAGNKKHAMHFENMGQVFMRSGSGEKDTYALFASGGILTQHKHFDNNNFVIYKGGYRAIDTGTRPQPGLHLSHYFARTVAHNCILIEMPGEEMPAYWGQVPASTEVEQQVPNDGGQQQVLGSKVLAFDENKDYVYVASDATEAYHADKSALVLRQFVYLLPDVFVVFDKVVSRNADYKKTWLFHTVAEPVMVNDREFYEKSEDGISFCRTIYPEQAVVTRIGGPGKQFWSGGKNWPIPVLTPQDWSYNRRGSIPKDTHPLLGQWRVEVSPDKPQSQDHFLHIIQVGDHTLKSLPKSKLIKKKDGLGVSFQYQSQTYELIFHTGEKHGGTISIKKGSRIVRNEELKSIQ